MTKKAVETKEAVIAIQPVEKENVIVRIKGDTPLIVHAWSKKAKQEMLDKQTGKTKTSKKAEKNPIQDFIESAYWMDGEPEAFTEEAFEEAISKGARFGFPVTAIKQGAAMAASRNGIDIRTTQVKGAFFIEGEGPDQLAEIHSTTPPRMREDMVRVGGISKTADIRYRAQFDDWYMDLKIIFNKNGPISLEQIINLINLGGFSCGLGEWRMEKNGNYGAYSVVGIVNQQA